MGCLVTSRGILPCGSVMRSLNAIMGFCFNVYETRNLKQYETLFELIEFIQITEDQFLGCCPSSIQRSLKHFVDLQGTLPTLE